MRCVDWFRGLGGRGGQARRGDAQCRQRHHFAPVEAVDRHYKFRSNGTDRAALDGRVRTHAMLLPLMGLLSILRRPSLQLDIQFAVRVKALTRLAQAEIGVASGKMVPARALWRNHAGAVMSE
jgi:hypothetical protein